MILFLSIYVGSKETISVFSLPIKNTVIIIDPGHGGIDPGALGQNDTVEDEINLAIALKLRRLIEQAGGLALMIREDDTGLYTEGKSRIRSKKNEDLKNRHELINESEADILISVHLNSFPQSQYYGAQTFYQIGDKKGKRLAEIIQNEFIAIIDKGNNRVSKGTDSVYILRDNKIPGALVECGFLSNYEEEQLLKDDHYQEKVAWCIFTGIVKYFAQEKAAEQTISQ
jgi:N-acetylmuramoyl-L-alanine amidase